MRSQNQVLESRQRKQTGALAQTLSILHKNSSERKDPMAGASHSRLVGIQEVKLGQIQLRGHIFTLCS